MLPEESGDTPPCLSIRVEKKPSEVGRVQHCVGAFWREHGLPDDRKLDVMVCIEEMLTNIFRHGDDAANEVEVRASVSGGEIEIQMIDDGPAFDPTAYPSPRLDLPLEKRRPGGLGIHLVHQLMDRVRYERKSGRNWLTMTIDCMKAGAAGSA